MLREPNREQHDGKNKKINEITSWLQIWRDLI